MIFGRFGYVSVKCGNFLLVINIVMFFVCELVSFYLLCRLVYMIYTATESPAETSLC